MSPFWIAKLNFHKFGIIFKQHGALFAENFSEVVPLAQFFSVSCYLTISLPGMYHTSLSSGPDF